MNKPKKNADAVKQDWLEKVMPQLPWEEWDEAFPGIKRLSDHAIAVEGPFEGGLGKRPRTRSQALWDELVKLYLPEWSRLVDRADNEVQGACGYSAEEILAALEVILYNEGIHYAKAAMFPDCPLDYHPSAHIPWTLLGTRNAPKIRNTEALLLALENNKLIRRKQSGAYFEVTRFGTNLGTQGKDAPFTCFTPVDTIRQILKELH